MASGDTLAIFTPQMNEPPATNFMTLDTRNGHLVLDADDTTDEAAVFKGILPRNYAGGGLTVYIHYAMTSATTNAVGWQVAFERVSDDQQDIDSDGFAAVQSVSDTVGGTTGFVSIVSIAFTAGAQIDSIAVGEGFRLKINRDADGSAVTDSATGDAEVWAIELKET